MNNNKKYIIYGLIFPNEKIYIGQTKDFRNRMYHHKNGKEFHSNKKLDNAVKKYKWENVQKEILLECDIEYADFFERAFISGYNSTNQVFGYNLESGGNKNKHLSYETRRKIGLANKGHIHSQESIEKMRNAKLGKKQTKEHIEKRVEKQTGKKRTKEMQKKMSDARKKFLSVNTVNMSGENNPWYGKHHSDEAKLKMNISHKGKKLSDSHKMKLSENSGFGMKGKNHSDEARLKMSQSKCKKINMFDLNGNFIKSFESLTSASKQLNINLSGISKVLKKEYKHTGGYIFKYKEKKNDKA